MIRLLKFSFQRKKQGPWIVESEIGEQSSITEVVKEIIAREPWGESPDPMQRTWSSPHIPALHGPTEIKLNERGEVWAIWDITEKGEEE